MKRDPVEFRMTVHLFGATSSPGCANFALKTTADQYEESCGREAQCPVRQLRSDQGTNFVGAKNELQKALSTLEHEKIRQELVKNSCDWVDFKMNVPEASHMGGAWERQIRTIRQS